MSLHGWKTKNYQGYNKVVVDDHPPFQVKMILVFTSPLDTVAEWCSR